MWWWWDCEGGREEEERGGEVSGQGHKSSSDALLSQGKERTDGRIMRRGSYSKESVGKKRVSDWQGMCAL